MIDKTLFDIFRAGSKTYFYSSMFFPGDVREDVFSLYSFVRLIDDLVDSVPPKTDEFYSFMERYFSALAGEPSDDVVIDSFVSLLYKKDFDPSWVGSFLSAMESDLSSQGRQSKAEIESYIHGSAEVVGLMMAKILNLPPKSHPYAMLLGKSMQYLNFIRDISEDLSLGRTYFPAEDFEEYNLRSIEYEDALFAKDSFTGFISQQLSYYGLWQKEAEEGFKYIPKRYLIPIKTASEMYKWTAEQIRKNPLVVYKLKVKPSIPRIVSVGAYNLVRL